jgi:hypothetical protein
MQKWFRRSLMALGALFIVIIPIAIFAQNLESEVLENFGIFLILIAFVLVGIVGISGLGTAFQWISKKRGDKVKRGLVYEDAMLNRVMNRLDDEERAYLQGYLNAQPYEPVEGFDSYSEEKSKEDYR